MKFTNTVSSKAKLLAGFIVVILFQLIIGAAALVGMWRLSSVTENLYRHPFTVSNATRDINQDMISMHRYIKDVVLSENEEMLEEAVVKVNRNEMQILKNFELLQQRYLGNKQDINDAYIAFIEWRVIRNRVIVMVREGRRLEAARITKGIGADQVALINARMKKMTDFAGNKADELYEESFSTKNIVLITMGVLLFLSIAISIYVSFTVIRNIISEYLVTNRKIREYLHLIDQNLLIISMSEKGEITDISNSFCRILGHTKSELLGMKCRDLFDGDLSDETFSKIWRTIRTGISWNGDISKLDASGKNKYFNLSIYPVLDDALHVTGYSIIINDISDKKAIERLSETDALTSLRNRRSYDSVFEMEFQKARLHEKILVLAILDIDYFKNYNDYYGHLAGDEALKKVADVLRNKMKRPSDFVFRIGGEEFALLFSDLDFDQARKLLERIRDAVLNLSLPHEASGVSKFLTVSIGAKLLKGNVVPDPIELFSLADKALYTAKKKRNSVEIC